MEDVRTELRPAAAPGLVERVRRVFGRGGPRARVAVSGAAHLGAPLEVEWSVEPARGATLVVVSLVGREIARRRVSARTGISTVPEGHDFYVVELDRRAHEPGGARAAGEGAAVVPAGLVPSFAAKFNEVAWSVVVDVSWGEAGRSRHEFPLTMLPERA
jgi:hypothetical protein